MSQELISALKALAEEKHIDELFLVERLEQSLAKTYATQLNLANPAKVIINRQTGSIYVFELVPTDDAVIDEATGLADKYDEVDVTPTEVSRIAASAAKRTILSIVREAARESVFSHYQARVGELLTGTVLQTTSDFTIIKVAEDVEAELPHFDTKRNPTELNERPEGEFYRHNQRLRAIIIAVRPPIAASGENKSDLARPTIVVSRTRPEFIVELFKMEVPEIYDGIVEIKSVVRDAGLRAKVAVASNDPKLDPLGATVGPKGSRVRMVVDELQGERIDIVPWSEEPESFIAESLQPAKIASVKISEDSKQASVIVPDDQLSLAIGQEGQNVRLAARLTGYNIDIKSLSMVESDDLPASLLGDEDSRDLEEVDTDRCEFVLEDGTHCRNHKRPGEAYCGVHLKASKAK